MKSIRFFLSVLPLATVFLFSACSDECPDCDGFPTPYSDALSPDDVLKDLQLSWMRRELQPYAALLAEDFRFYFDPDTREARQLPEFWNRSLDSLQVGKIFSSSEVADIRISLTYPETCIPSIESGHETWCFINVSDTFLEVELRPTPGDTEGLTLRVDGQTQRFYFRKGRTPADTLSSSPTANRYYIVEWRDLGFGATLLSDHRAPSLAVENTTWSTIKTIYN